MTHNRARFWVIEFNRVKLYGIFRYRNNFWMKFLYNGARVSELGRSWGEMIKFSGNEKVACFADAKKPLD